MTLKEYIMMTGGIDSFGLYSRNDVLLTKNAEATASECFRHSEAQVLSVNLFTSSESCVIRACIKLDEISNEEEN